MLESIFPILFEENVKENTLVTHRVEKSPVRSMYFKLVMIKLTLT
jgi:hypothetical protein